MLTNIVTLFFGPYCEIGLMTSLTYHSYSSWALQWSHCGSLEYLRKPVEMVAEPNLIRGLSHNSDHSCRTLLAQKFHKTVMWLRLLVSHGWTEKMLTLPFLLVMLRISKNTLSQWSSDKESKSNILYKYQNEKIDLASDYSVKFDTKIFNSRCLSGRYSHIPFISIATRYCQ